MGKNSSKERRRIEGYIEEHYPELSGKILLADGFDEAFIGVSETFGDNPRACYCYYKCLDLLMEDFIASDPSEGKGDGIVDFISWYDEAEQYFSYNVECSYVGDYTPAFVKTIGYYE
tara:strand:+ start:1700 stop:2050 length:351 start_codon:yes stop_codon:yes gene_type:complete